MQVPAGRGQPLPDGREGAHGGLGGLSLLLSYLMAMHAVTDSYEVSATLLSETRGFRVTPTAVQRNTESMGAQLPDSPHQGIAAGKIREPCGLMVVEVDGTMTPQIAEKEGVTGRGSLKQPTEYKECSVVAIEMCRQGTRIDRRIRAKHGPRRDFGEYVRPAGLAMRQLRAPTVGFIADGARSNWEHRKTNFPGAVETLGLYHAAEHVAELRALYGAEGQGTHKRHRWTGMMRQGDVLQMIHEMTQAALSLPDPEKGLKQIRYVPDNAERMRYDEYEKCGLPRGSGRWQKRDNEAVLRARLAHLSGTLASFFQPHPAPFTSVAQEAAA